MSLFSIVLGLMVSHTCYHKGSVRPLALLPHSLHEGVPEYHILSLCYVCSSSDSLQCKYLAGHKFKFYFTEQNTSELELKAPQ